MTRTIAFDVDGVLANFYLHVCRKFNKPYEAITEWDLDWLNFGLIANDEEFWRTLPVLNQPELIQEILNTNDLILDSYITALPKAMTAARQFWLDYHKFPKAELIVCRSQDKLKICQDRKVDIFIDDKPETCLHFEKESKHTQVYQYCPEYALSIQNAHNMCIFQLRHLNHFI
jgi:uncharacterized HAD superfamily protein